MSSGPRPKDLPKFPEHTVASTDGQKLTIHESSNDLALATAALVANSGSRYVKIKDAKVPKLPKVKTPK